MSSFALKSTRNRILLKFVYEINIYIAENILHERINAFFQQTLMHIIYFHNRSCHFFNRIFNYTELNCLYLCF